MRFRDARAIIRLSWPILVAQLAVLANGVADTVMTGHYRAIHLAAVGIGASIYITVFIAGLGMLQGLSPIIARLFGANDKARIGLQVRQGALLALAVALPGVAVLSFPAPLLALVRVPGAVMPVAIQYLHATAFGLPAILLARVFYSLAPAVGKPRAVMAINLCALAVKIPLSYALLFGRFGLPELGGPGCGVASSIAAWLMLALACTLLLRDPFYREFHVFEGSLRPDGRALKALLKLGVPSGIAMLVEVTSFTFMMLILARLGAVVTAANQIISNLAALLYMLPLSLGVGTQVLLSQALGRGEAARAREITLAGLRVAACAGITVSILLILARASVLRLYTDDGAVFALAMSLLPPLAFYHIWDALQAVVIFALRGYHRALIPMLVYVAMLWGVGLGGGYWLGIGGIELPMLGVALAPLGAKGLWLCAGAGLCLASLILAGYLLRVSRETINAGQASLRRAQ